MGNTTIEGLPISIVDQEQELAINSDINGARNIAKLSSNYQKKKCNNLKKLCNPIKVENDYKFIRLLKDRWNYNFKKETA
ncbi:hypothetical protein [Halanaerobaculum tunisiense]